MTATDTTGNSTEATFTVIVRPGTFDRTAPVVRITLPSSRTTTVPSTFGIAGTVNENLALETFVVKVNGVPQTLDAPLAFVPKQNVPWSVTGAIAENGPNVIEVTATDFAGRVGRAVKTVTYVNNRPELAGIYDAVLLPAGTPGLDNFGLVTLTARDSGAFSGRAYLGGTSFSFSGFLANDGSARFNKVLGATIEFRVGRGTAARSLGFLALNVSGVDGLGGNLSSAASGGTVLARFQGKKAPYHKRNLVPVGLLNQPITGTPTKGIYNAGFPSKVQNPVISTSLYPQGDGYASLTLANSGGVSLSGYLADGRKYTASGRLRSDGSVALFTRLYRNKGGFAGELAFSDLGDSDVSGTNLLWIRPALPTSRLYPSGWTTGVRVDAMGTKYALPASLDFGQGLADAFIGNARLVFTDGLLANPQTHAVSIDPMTGRVVKIPATNPNYSLSLDVRSGVFSGPFLHTDATRAGFRGILLNKGANRGGFGYFLSNGPVSGSGGVSIDPDEP